jgi:hypothetical protein
MRAVILHHTGFVEDHFDLLIEQEVGIDRVWTWRVSSHPIAESTRIVRLADHRRMYLDYDGKVSGNRGEVRCVWRGEVELVSRQPIEVLGLPGAEPGIILPG